MAKFEMYRNHLEEFGFHLKAGNGQIILSSKSYKNKLDCISGIESVKSDSQNSTNFEVLVGSNGSPRFNLKSTTGDIIGFSQDYSSESSMRNGILSVRKNAWKAEIVEKETEIN